MTHHKTRVAYQYHSHICESHAHNIAYVSERTKDQKRYAFDIMTGFNLQVLFLCKQKEFLNEFSENLEQLQANSMY